MASLSSARALLPAAHGVPAAALKAAATSGASFLVVCPAGDRAKAVLAALQAATRGAGLVLSSRVVARATKRSGGRTGEDPEEVDDVFFVGAGEEVADDDNNTKVENAFFLGAGEEDAHGDTNPKDVFLGPGDSTHQMTMDELVLTFTRTRRRFSGRRRDSTTSQSWPAWWRRATQSGSRSGRSSSWTALKAASSSTGSS